MIFGNSGGGNDVTNCSNHLTITESLLGGGGYTLYPCAHASQAGSSSYDIERNHFARCATAESYNASNGTHPCSGGADTSGYYPGSGSFGLATNYFTPAASGAATSGTTPVQGLPRRWQQLRMSRRGASGSPRDEVVPADEAEPMLDGLCFVWPSPASSRQS